MEDTFYLSGGSLQVPSWVREYEAALRLRQERVEGRVAEAEGGGGKQCRRGAGMMRTFEQLPLTERSNPDG